MKKAKISEGWSCKICTLINSAEDLVCNACGETNLKDFEWICESCTTINHVKNNKCSMCGNSKVDEVDPLVLNYKVNPLDEPQVQINGWIQQSNGGYKHTLNKPFEGKEYFSICTFNVWFEDVWLPARYKEQLNFLKKATFDFVCLQEVTQPW